MSKAFHLNKDAKREQNIKVEGNSLRYNLNSTYLGVTLDSKLTYRHHLETLSKKLISRIALLWRLACTSWEARAATLRISTLALVYSTAKLSQCPDTPAWQTIQWCHAHRYRMPETNSDRVLTSFFFHQLNFVEKMLRSHWHVRI